MATDADPIPESWYQHTDKGQEFQVIDVDKDAEVIEIQYFDGSVEEIDLNEWYQLEIEPTEEPENWSGALDIAEVDDLGTSVTDTDSDDWNAPLQEIHQHEPEEQDPDLTELNDEWGDGTGEEELGKKPNARYKKNDGYMQEPYRVNHKQKHTLEAIHQDPPSANIHWRDVEALLHALGAEIQVAHGARLHLLLRGAESTIHRPHHSSTLSKQEVRHLRDFLTQAGY